MSQQISLQFPKCRKCLVHSQCTRSCDQNFPKKVPSMFLSGSLKRKCSVHSQCARSCDQNVPIRKSIRKPWNLPKKVPPNVSEWLIWNFLYNVPTGVITMYQVGKIQNELKQCAGNVPKWRIQNELTFPPQCTMFGTFLVNLWNIASTFKMFSVSQFP